MEEQDWIEQHKRVTVVRVKWNISLIELTNESGWTTAFPTFVFGNRFSWPGRGMDRFSEINEHSMVTDPDAVIPADVTVNDVFLVKVF